MLSKTLRILDATFNRATEGLRVAEDFVRFELNDSYLTESLKKLRHDLHVAIETIPSFQRLVSRDTSHDVGTEITTPGETNRQDLPDVFFANMQRARQSLRSLEEFGKIIEPRFAGQIEALRYRLYTLEKAVAVSYESTQRLQDVSLCVLVDGMNTVAEFSAHVEKLLNAGVGMIQLRDNQLADSALFDCAKTLVSQVMTQAMAQTTKQRDASRLPLTIINNRPDIAAAANADGVHLGQEDLSAKAAREILGPRKLIGISTHSIEQARSAVLDGANYLGAGPTFCSTTKSFDAFPGLDYLRQITSEISLPTFAIGGIQAENLPQVLEMGATRVAVSGAVAKAPDPGETASELLQILRDAAAR